MSKKKRASPWGKYKAPKRMGGVVVTNIPINRMSEFEDDTKKALPKFAHEAWLKEFELRNACGPGSVSSDEWYPKTVKAIKYPKEEE